MSPIGLLAGALALRLGRRPSELLGLEGNGLSDLLLDAAIIKAVDELTEAETEDEERKMLTLSEEIERKRRKMILRWYYGGRS